MTDPDHITGCASRVRPGTGMLPGERPRRAGGPRGRPMTDVRPTVRDLEIWDRLFASVPAEWRTAPPSAAMTACAEWLGGLGVRSVLDLGCGIGRWTVWLRQQGFDA